MRTFFPLTRLEPARAGISPTHVATSELAGIMLHVDALPLGVDIGHFSAGLAEAVAGVSQSAKWHVGLAAVRRAVDRDDAGAAAIAKRFGAMNAARVDRGSQSEARVVGDPQCVLEVRDAIQ